jgi:RHS repeat-associated protein
VMAVVSDHKLPEGNSWRAYVQSRTDYYAFGAAMPGRSGGAGYRYGFGGQERAHEFGRDTYAYEARMYSALLGRWMSVDPLAVKYPAWSSYNYCLNNPIIFVDKDGRDTWYYTQSGLYLGRVKNDLPNSVRVMNENIRSLFSHLNSSMQNQIRPFDRVPYRPLTTSEFEYMHKNSVEYMLDDLLVAYNTSMNIRNRQGFMGSEIGLYLMAVDNPSGGEMVTFADNLYITDKEETTVRLHSSGNANNKAKGLYLSLSQETLSKIVSYFHTHPMIGDIRDYYHGPSDSDYFVQIHNSLNTNPGFKGKKYFSLVIDEDNVYFFYHQTSDYDKKFHNQRTTGEKRYGGAHKVITIDRSDIPKRSPRTVLSDSNKSFVDDKK